MDAIKKFRLKFIITTMIILFGVLFAIGLSIIITLIISEDIQASRLLNKLEYMQPPPDDQENDVYTSDPFNEMPKEGMNRARLYLVKLEDDDTIAAFFFDGDYFQEEDIKETVMKITEGDRLEGSIGKIRFIVKKSGDTRFVAAIDRSIEQEFISSTARKITVIGILSLAVLFIIVLILSEWITKPVKVMLEKQKQFVSDASHELKTPLTVISANTDVLIEENGDNKWLSSIKSQTNRMSGLVKDLLSLAKSEELKPEVQTFDLSSVVNSAALPFESLAYENNKELKLNIPENISFRGDAESIKTAVSILLDNAVKHSDPNGTITLTLTDEPALSVKSSGCNLDEKEIERLFERFYRKDSSRQNVGGYGLGLSILSKIAKNNKWKLNVRSQKHEFVSFIIHF